MLTLTELTLTKQEKDKLEKLSSYMVGILAEEDDYYPPFGCYGKVVDINKNSDNLIFYVKCISLEPDDIIQLDMDMAKNKLSTLYSANEGGYLNKYMSPEYKYIKDTFEKRDLLEKYLKDKVILFKPKIKFTSENKVFKNIDIVNIEKNTCISEFGFYPVPQITRKTMDHETLERIFLNHQPITLREYPEGIEEPSYILCGEYLYSNFKDNSWERLGNIDDAWINKNPETIKRIKINNMSNEYKEKIIYATEELIFIDRSYLVNNIDNQIALESLTIKDIYESRKEEEIEINTRFENIEKASIKEMPEKLKEDSKDDLELEFLQVLKHEVLNKHLCYNHKDLINFHISIKTNPLTILSGLSGIGKTKLAKTYANALGLTQNNGKLLIVPITPSYTEPSDILGYLNINNGMYIAAETQLVDFLVRAQKDSQYMYIVIFDEMNLAQIEHWFSPFISLLELEKEDRILRLYNKNEFCRNQDKYPGEITIGENIRFIGTINLDETTRDISDRLLDRANIITPSKMGFLELKENVESFQMHSNEELEDIKKLKLLKENFSTSKTYFNWIKNKPFWEIFNDEELIFFDNLHNMIEKDEIGVSFRAIEKIANYIYNMPKNDGDKMGKLMFSKEYAIDIQVKQRLLTKIRGTRIQFEGLIGLLPHLNDELTNSKLYNYFSSEDVQKISDFAETLKEIKRKARELNMYDYAN